MANYNLRNLEAAEKSAREAQKLDTQHRIPKIDHLLGVILAQRRDYTGAAVQMKSYLKFAPGATDDESLAHPWTVPNRDRIVSRLSGEES